MLTAVVLAFVVTGILADGPSGKSSSSLFRDFSHGKHYLTRDDFAQVFLSFHGAENGLSLSEFEAGWSSHHLRDPAEAGFYFMVADENDDLKVTREDMDYLFTIMDLSADDRLSTTEFTQGWHDLFELKSSDDDDD